MVRRRLRFLAVLVVAAPVLAACRSEGVSLDEAKAIAAGYPPAPVAAPPRRIDDIVSILERERSTDVAFLTRLRTIADADVPATGNAAMRARQFLERARAARNLGRAKQEIADYREAVRHLEAAGDAALKSRASLELGAAEVRAGNFSRGLGIIQKAVSQSAAAAGASTGNSAALIDVYTRSGDFSKADALLARTRRLLPSLGDIAEFSSADRAAFRVVFAQGKALILERKGLLAEAEAAYRGALETWRAVRDGPSSGQASGARADRVHSLLLTRLADNLRRQGRYVEAELESRKALLGVLDVHGKYSTQAAAILRILTQVIHEQGRYREAEVLARANLEIFRRTGASAASLNHALARSLLGDILVVQERWREALATYEGIKDDLGDDPAAFNRFVAGNVNWALVHMQSGRPEAALGILAQALRRALEARGEGDIETVEIRGYMAAAHGMKGDLTDSLDNFMVAVPLLLAEFRERSFAGRASLVHDRRFEFILESFIDLLNRVRGTRAGHRLPVEAAAEMFRLADVLRGRTVQRALSASASRAGARNPELAELVRLQQDSERQLVAIEQLLADQLAAPRDQRRKDAVAGLNRRRQAMRAARAALLDEIEDGFPEYKDLISPNPPTLDEVQSALGAGEALLAFLVGAERTYVWAVPKEGAVAFAAVDISREDLSDRIALLRGALDSRFTTLGDIPAFDVAAAYELYEMLLKPVEAGWRSAESLLVVPDGALGYLPISVLPTEPARLGAAEEVPFADHRVVPWLARRHAVTVLPTVASIASLRASPPAPAGRRSFVGFAAPTFSIGEAAEAEDGDTVELARIPDGLRGLPVKLRSRPAMRAAASAELALLPPLPETAWELRSIAEALGARPDDVHVGRAATEERVKSMDLSPFRIVAFATHGLVAGDLNGLDQPALALAAPAPGDDDDGLLTMGEILGLRLNADWVVLSACNTGAAGGKGAEAVSGLGRAFFYAGSRALLVSNWPVHSNATVALTTTLFRRQAEICARFASVAKAVDTPIMLFNTPQRSGFGITHDYLEAMLDVAPIVAVKQSDPNFAFVAQSLRQFRDRLAIFVGNGTNMLTARLMGSAGFISTGPDLLGDDIRRILEVDALGVEERLELQARVHLIFNTMLASVPGAPVGAVGPATDPAPYKAALGMIGLPAGIPRDPVRPATPEIEAHIRDVLDRLGIIARETARRAAAE